MAAAAIASGNVSSSWTSDARVARFSARRKSTQGCSGCKSWTGISLSKELSGFSSAHGLPTDKVPTMKELASHGRQDLANAVRRRGYKAVAVLLAKRPLLETEAVVESVDQSQEKIETFQPSAASNGSSETTAEDPQANERVEQKEEFTGGSSKQKQDVQYEQREMAALEKAELLKQKLAPLANSKNMGKLESESISDFLRSRYPSHPQIEDVANLESAGFTRLDELRNLNLDRLAMYVPHLFCLALRAYVKGGGPDPVAANCTRTMSLAHTRETVKLRPENHIPQLPAQYSPMFDPTPEDEPVSNAAANPRLNAVASPDSNPAASDEDELSLLDAADVKRPDEPGLLELEMIKFEQPAALKIIWCSYGASKILVRKDYVAVQQKVLALWATGTQAVLLVGVPGIGKTGFIIIMLLYLIEQRKPVVFCTKGGSYYFFEPQAPGEHPLCYKLGDNSILLDPEVYLLADGKLPDVPEFGGNALLASTPKLANYQDFGKDGRGDMVLLPVWYAAEVALAWQEIHDPNLQPELAEVRAQGYGQFRARQALTLDVVKDRYRKWGGTARFVLARPQADLDKIMEGLQSIQATVEAVSKQLADGEHPSHKLVHMKVRPDYQGYEYIFASPYVAQAARRKLKQATSQSLRLFLSFRGLDAHGANGLKGIIFQDEFKHIARQRKTFKVREVFQSTDAQASEQDMVFEFGEPVDVANLASLPSPAPVNRIIWPASRIEETIDAMRIVRKPGQQDILELHQATVSSGRLQHGLKYSAVLAIMKQLRIPPSRTVIYIDTTAELFLTAGYQNWRRSGNLVLKDTSILKELEGVRQYVLNSTI